MTATKKTFSALEMQRQLGHKRYQPIWEMMHKLRSVTGIRDDRYKLQDTVELDEASSPVMTSARMLLRLMRRKPIRKVRAIKRPA